MIASFLGLDLFHEMEANKTSRFKAVELHAVAAEVADFLDLLALRRVNDSTAMNALVGIAFPSYFAGHTLGEGSITL